MTERSAEAAAATPSGAETKTAPRPRPMAPSAALARHVEWLEFALGAAKSEETWRAARLEKATKRNRDKRSQRLDEVRDEIEELSALLTGIRALQARAPRRSGAGSRRSPSGTAKKTAGTKATPARRTRAAGPNGTA
jgi:hypothetical protein